MVSIPTCHVRISVRVRSPRVAVRSLFTHLIHSTGTPASHRLSGGKAPLVNAKNVLGQLCWSGREVNAVKHEQTLSTVYSP